MSNSISLDLHRKIFIDLVLFYKDKCANLMEPTYLRSNLCGHETGNIDTKKRDIGRDDVFGIMRVVRDNKN